MHAYNFIADVAYFDNTYSWVSSKKLSYLIEVLEPTSEMEVTSL